MSRRREDRFDELYPGSDFTTEESRFLRAVDRYKCETGRLFLSWHEVLRLIKQLGYRKPFLPVADKPKNKTRKRVRS